MVAKRQNTENVPSPRVQQRKHTYTIINTQIYTQPHVQLEARARSIAEHRHY